MTRRTVLVVVGSRPEAIKLAPVVMALRRRPEQFEAILCSTGQQQHLIPQALAEFGLEPDLELAAMTAHQSLADLTARLLARLEAALIRTAPDWVLVQGDTTSAMTGALAGFYARVPVGHVEAGMRTDDIWSPYPEEVNRRMITQCATLHFAPTPGCAAHLAREGVPPARVLVTGNTVVDALHWIRDCGKRHAVQMPEAVSEAIRGRRLIFATTHRRESVGEGIAGICEALRALVQQVPDTVVVLPMHPNPAVRETVLARLDREPRIVLIEPQPYRVTVELVSRAYLLLTDSGGLQEEAPTFGTPVLVLRDTTERPEGVEAGVARLVGTDPDTILSHALELLQAPEARAAMSTATSPYGDGAAAGRIAAALAAAPARGPARSDRRLEATPSR